jgi:hypothetical protein
VPSPTESEQNPKAATGFCTLVSWKQIFAAAGIYSRFLSFNYAHKSQ